MGNEHAFKTEYILDFEVKRDRGCEWEKKTITIVIKEPFPPANTRKSKLRALDQAEDQLMAQGYKYIIYSES